MVITAPTPHALVQLEHAAVGAAERDARRRRHEVGARFYGAGPGAARTGAPGSRAGGAAAGRARTFAAPARSKTALCARSDGRAAVAVASGLAARTGAVVVGVPHFVPAAASAGNRPCQCQPEQTNWPTAHAEPPRLYIRQHLSGAKSERPTLIFVPSRGRNSSGGSDRLGGPMSSECPRCGQRAPIVLRGLDSRCAACGAPRSLLAAPNMALAGQPSRVGGLAASIAGVSVMVLGLSLSAGLWFLGHALAASTTLAWALAVPVFGASMLFGLLLLLGGTTLRRRGAARRQAVALEAVSAMVAHRRG